MVITTSALSAKVYVLEKLKAGLLPKEILKQGKSKYSEFQIVRLLGLYPDADTQRKLGKTPRRVFYVLLAPIVITILFEFFAVIFLHGKNNHALAQDGLFQLARLSLWFFLMKEVIIGNRRSFLVAAIYGAWNVIYSSLQVLLVFLSPGIGLSDEMKTQVATVILLSIVPHFYVAAASIKVLKNVWIKPNLGFNKE